MDYGTGLASLFAAKARVPLLPRGHVPRPERLAELLSASRSVRLVEVIGAGLAGKTTLLAEFARSLDPRSILWYTLDELDETTRSLFEGLASAVIGDIPPGDETHLLAAIIDALARRPGPVVLILDDAHRSAAAGAVIGRLLRYLPGHVCLMVAGREGGAAPAALRRWLEDQGQVMVLGTESLRLDEEERERFVARAGADRGVWPISYRPGGHSALVAELRDEILPSLPDLPRRVINLLAVAPTCTVSILAQAAGLPMEEIETALDTLADQTVLLELADHGVCRLSDNARIAALAALDPAARRAALTAMGAALESIDPCSAAVLFAREREYHQALRAAGRAGLAAWYQREADAVTMETLVPGALLRTAPSLVLFLANRTLVREGAAKVHATIRAIRPVRQEEQVDRLRLLGLCARARRRPWAFQMVLAGVKRVSRGEDATFEMGTRCYALSVEGTLLLAGDEPVRAAAAFRRALSTLNLTGAEVLVAAGTRLLSLHGLALACRRMGRLEDAERLYGEAYALAGASGKIGFLLETANNRAMLLHVLGRNDESAACLREALGHPWAAEVGLRPLLLASLSDVLAARDERTEAVRLLYKVLAEAPADDPRALSDHAHAMLSLLLAEADDMPSANQALARAPATHPAALIARALLSSPIGSARLQLEAAAESARGFRPLAAHARAHLARILAVEGDINRARNLAAELRRKSRYPIAPWDEAILAQIAPHTTSCAADDAAATPPHHVVLRFFGGPTATIGDTEVGKDGWRYMEARTLFWYALAHGKRGFSRDDLALDLFPELDGEQAGKALRNTFYALRKMFKKLGVGHTLPMKDGRGVLLPGDLCPSYQSDLDRLHACIKSVQAGEQRSAAELLSLLEHPFMADLEGDWLAPFRAYWNGEAIRALQLAATAAEQTGRAQEALVLLRRQAEFSPDDPAIARRILLVAHAMADSGAVRATYLEHCRVARDELGVEPDPSVVALYARLTRS